MSSVTSPRRDRCHHRSTPCRFGYNCNPYSPVTVAYILAIGKISQNSFLCPPLLHVPLYVPHSCISPTPACSPLLYVPHSCMSPTPVCSPLLHVPHSCMFPTPACPPLLHVPHSCMSPTPACSPLLHVPHSCMYTFLSFHCPFSNLIQNRAEVRKFEKELAQAKYIKVHRPSIFLA